MNAANTKFSSGDTIPQMTSHQYRTTFDLGSDHAWKYHEKKKREAERAKRKQANPFFGYAREVVAQWVEATKDVRDASIQHARRAFLTGKNLSETSIKNLKRGHRPGYTP